MFSVIILVFFFLSTNPGGDELCVSINQEARVFKEQKQKLK
jgi:hypothetical protein